MLITIKRSAAADDIHKICQLLDRHNLRHCLCKNKAQTIIGLETNPSEEIRLELNKIEALKNHWHP